VGKYSEETKLAVVEDCCSGTAGLKVVARRHDVNVASLRKWVEVRYIAAETLLRKIFRGHCQVDERRLHA
jgi:transposase